MSLQIPTTTQIRDSLFNRIDTALTESFVRLPKTFIFVLCTVLAGVLSIMYKYIGYMFLQQYPQFAGTDVTEINGKKLVPLVEWGRLLGVGDPTSATRWEGTISITVLVQGGILPTNTQLIFTQTGVIYITLGSVALDASTVQATIRAVSDPDGNGGRGTYGNLNPGDTVVFVNPQSNVAQNTTVLAETVTGANAESWDTYRTRVVGRFQAPPQGGALIDYRIWSEQIGGINRAYPYTGDPGQVHVYCQATTASSGSADGIPTVAQLEAIQTALDLVRPANAYVTVLSITRTSIDIVINGFEPDNTALEDDIKADIETALAEYILGREPYIIGVSTGVRKDRISHSALYGIIQDIIASYGGIFTSVQIFVSDIYYLTYILGEGEKAKLGNVTHN